MKTVVVMLLGVGVLAGCSEPPVQDLAAVGESLPVPRRKVVLIGLDGADWNVARPLMKQGRLPVLASLVADGASGDMRSLAPMISPALWTTAVTGFGRDDHGIRDFVYKEAGKYAQPIVNSSIRRRLALWNILSELGMSVGVLDWYATWPAEEVNGFIVSDRIRTVEPSQAGVTYPAYAALEDIVATDRLPPLPRLPALERFRERYDELPVGLAKGLKEDLHRYRLARSLYRARKPDFFAFYLKGLDAVGHLYWKYHEPGSEVYGSVDAEGVERHGSMIADYYELCDQLLGEFLEEVDEDTTVVVISDHGFRAFGRPESLIFDVDRLFAILGLLEFEDPSLVERRSERSVRMTGTKAYVHEGTQIVSVFGRRDRPVYLNVVGRDPEGTIEPRRLDAARREIAHRLRALETDLGTPLFTSIRVNDSPGVEGIVQEPDLHLRVNGEIAFDHKLTIDGRDYPLFDTFLWEYGNISGTHRDLGIFVARGPSIRGGARVDGASLLDVAPTILRVVGAPVPDDLAGRVIRGLLEDGFGENAMRVASYESLIERSYPEVATDLLDEEYRERLRSLGYVQ